MDGVHWTRLGKGFRIAKSRRLLAIAVSRRQVYHGLTYWAPYARDTKYLKSLCVTKRSINLIFSYVIWRPKQFAARQEPIRRQSCTRRFVAKTSQEHVLATKRMQVCWTSWVVRTLLTIVSLLDLTKGANNAPRALKQKQFSPPNPRTTKVLCCQTEDARGGKVSNWDEYVQTCST